MKGITNASGGVLSGSIGQAQLADGSVTAEKIASGAVSHIYPATIAVDAWSGDAAPYTAYVTVDGILKEDKPDVDLVASDSYEEAEMQIEAWGYVYRGVTSANAITFYATEKPEVDIPVHVRAVRK